MTHQVFKPKHVAISPCTNIKPKIKFREWGKREREVKEREEEKEEVEKENKV